MSSLRSTFLTYSAVGLGALAVIAVVAWFVVGRLLRPIRLLRDTTRRITESDLSERITVTGKDDLSEPGPHGERDARPARSARSGRSASSSTTSATSCARR